jgi:predicted HicB family RNase H-like nuclease
MAIMAGHDPMAKKKSEARKHTAMIRVDEEARERATKAASLMGMSLADYASAVLKKTADRDLLREAKKITGEGEK